MSPVTKNEPDTYYIKGKELRCPICQNNKFTTKSVLLNTTAMTFFNLDWANRNAQCFICTDCTHIMWFNGKY